MTSSKVCIVGTGAAGLLCLFCLSFTSIPPEDIICIDPYHDGGELQRKWSCVKSNTTWDQLLQVLRSKQISLETLPSYLRDIDPSKPTELQNYIEILRCITKPFVSRCETLYSLVTSFEEEKGQVRVHFGEKESILAKICIVATGSIPKHLQYPIPTIPLDIALNPKCLQSYIRPHQTVSVFGTAHSGTLILSNLHHLKANTHAFYKGEKPFLFARDGEYDGIKQESETIADQILSGNYPQTFLHSITNTAELIRWTRRSDWVVYASGFQRTHLTSSFSYDDTTGRILHLPNTWGFGIAFPNRASDGVHLDVGISSFFEHIEKQIPKIVESFYA
jgi:hypothetical protein